MSDEDVNLYNIEYVEQLYREWKKDNGSVGKEWHNYFIHHEKDGIGKSERTTTQDMVYKQSRVDSLVWAYRDVGYLYAKLNPLIGYLSADLHYLHKQEKGSYERLTLKEFGLSENDLDTLFSGGRHLKPSNAPLREIVEALKRTYCSSVGVEFLHIQNKPIRRWLIKEMESIQNKPHLNLEKQQIIIQDLIKAEEFEHFLHTQFIGQKRFSLEGSEVLIPALHFLVDSAVERGVEEIVIGMSHRGRLNVLSNIMNKSAEEIFAEFENIQIPDLYGGAGDVKYHLGYKKNHVHRDGKLVHINLVPNPSHLESIDPVVEGIARGIQTLRKDAERKKVIPILIHGDAAFSGQGVVAETFNLSQLTGYNTGGTLHIIVNNQIGFTTSTKEARSTFFPTDVAKMIPVPIFHVNGDDPEAVVHVVNLALNFRQEFGRDVVIDIFCYRRHGHNEGDEPSFTHPLMYKHIKDHPSVARIYGKRLDELGVMSAEEQQKMRTDYQATFKQALHHNSNRSISPGAERAGEKSDDFRQVKTEVSLETLAEITEKITTIPHELNAHSKLRRILKEREESFKRGGPIDFSLAESLAFGSLLMEGISIRLSGEDSARGTFSQRHALWWDTDTPEPVPYTPFNILSEQTPVENAHFGVFDSPLSEFSVLGFEYGYSLAQPEELVIWEAQFGDFCNGAQVIIDNYIGSGESKWHVSSGLVLLLPHGYEGQGPEHSNAHLERFLQLCAENNIQVCNPSAPAQYFHLLRRQAKKPFKKPLIIMTPKSLLRYPKAVSAIEEFSSGSFHEVIDDPAPPERADSLIFCSGKIFYELFETREKQSRKQQSIVRIEQLYPFPQEKIRGILKRYRDMQEIYWVQEEPYNRGAWHYMNACFTRQLGMRDLKYIGRKESASPATGFHARHRFEQQAILEAVFKEAYKPHSRHQGNVGMFTTAKQRKEME